MSQVETTLPELFEIIAVKEVILNKQEKALVELSKAYNQKVEKIKELEEKNESLLHQLNLLKELPSNIFPIERANG